MCRASRRRPAIRISLRARCWVCQMGAAAIARVAENSLAEAPAGSGSGGVVARIVSERRSSPLAASVTTVPTGMRRVMSSPPLPGLDAIGATDSECRELA